MIHEVGHLVFEVYIKGTQLEKEWEKLAFSVKNRKKDEPADELFCHSYACHFVKYPLLIHYHKVWDDFIKKICKITKPAKQFT